ncbi:MAG: hypothetical protein HFJ11_05930 [Bacilli bacterium]|nr:hypothetical protein [Bacilli bacterium]
MNKISLVDKVSIFFEVSKTINLILLIVLILLSIIFLNSNKKNAKNIRYIYTAFISFTLIYFFIKYNISLNKMFDYMMNNFFIAIYFPNLAIYAFGLIITNIIFYISLFNYKVSKIIKKINIVVYIFINYLFFLVLKIINMHQLDIYSQNSVYGNRKALALIELSSLIFIIWIVFLTIYKIFIFYLKKEYKQPVKKIIRIKKVKKLPENFIPKEFPTKVNGNISKKTFNKNEEDELLKIYDNMLTLEDYKTIIKILQNHKSKENAINENNITTPPILEKTQIENYKETENIISKIEEEQEKRKFTELEELYKELN